MLQRPVERVVGDLLPVVHAGHEVRPPGVLLQLGRRGRLALQLQDVPIQRNRADVILASGDQEGVLKLWDVSGPGGS